MLYLENSDIYHEVVQNGIFQAKNHIYIATANLKDIYINTGKRNSVKSRNVSIVRLFAGLCGKGVEIRILYSSGPSEPFLKDMRKHRLDKCRNFMMRRCVRCHLKTVVVDGEKVFIGSANFSSAGLGARLENRRNFEAGIISEELELVDKVSSFFRMIWNGNFCTDCGKKERCNSIAM